MKISQIIKGLAALTLLAIASNMAYKDSLERAESTILTPEEERR